MRSAELFFGICSVRLARGAASVLPAFSAVTIVLIARIIAWFATLFDRLAFAWCLLICHLQLTPCLLSGVEHAPCHASHPAKLLILRLEVRAICNLRLRPAAACTPDTQQPRGAAYRVG
jgi:hypothetical protein